MKHPREATMMKVGIICFVFTVCLLVAVAPSVPDLCTYCREITAPPSIQTCNGLGSSSCGVLYTQGQTVCCAPSGSGACEGAYIAGTTERRYYYTMGSYCNGQWHCTGGTSSAHCAGEFISASSYDCVPWGAIQYSTDNASYCEE